MSELPKGYTCKCGTFHEFHVWVYAHWDILIEATCEQCKRVATMRRGRVLKYGRKPK